MLKMQDIHAYTADKEILKGISLNVKPGEVHAIMGPNGAGKSTLSRVLAGHPDYTVTSGSILFNNKNLLEMKTEERACEGIFMAFQYPVEIPGVNNTYFLRAAYNAKQKYHNLQQLDAIDFLKLVKSEMKKIQMEETFISRAVNQGFSGGEKKRNEILQMQILKPSLAILDETDSGLDIDALRIIAEGINLYRSDKVSMIIITHYQRLLDYIVPDYVHVLFDGKIVKSGDKNLALELEQKGYDWIRNTAVV